MLLSLKKLRARVPALGAALALLLAGPAALASVHQGNGIKIGEVSADSAVIWTRLTVAPEANWTGAAFLPPSVPASELPPNAAKAGLSEENRHRVISLVADPATQLPPGRTLAQMHGALPGAAGSVRVTLRPSGGGAAIETPWTGVDPARDHTAQFTLRALQPGTGYTVRVESRDAAGRAGAVTEGSFRTAPGAASAPAVKFAVITCGDYPRRDDPANGHRLYDTLRRTGYDFAVHTGDVEYYDKPDPWATSAALARFKWNRIYALPFPRDFHRTTPVYFTNDDHDILTNDCWPGMTHGRLTWTEGLAIWDEQVPVSPLPYRTFRYGRDLQVWIVEGRRWRSRNNAPDGPDKTILGAEQKAWLLRTLAASDATFKVLVSPTPLVGPDRGNKNDNHANAGFRHEGDELRRALSAHKNLITTNGDRHWQYFSIDPATGLREFGCGPMSDVHAGGYNPQPGDEAIQKFFRLKGGFLTVATVPGATAAASRLVVQHHAVDGTVAHRAELDAAGKLLRAGAP